MKDSLFTHYYVFPNSSNPYEFCGTQEIFLKNILATHFGIIKMKDFNCDMTNIHRI